MQVGLGVGNCKDYEGVPDVPTRDVRWSHWSPLLPTQTVSSLNTSLPTDAQRVSNEQKISVLQIGAKIEVFVLSSFFPVPVFSRSFPRTSLPGCSIGQRQSQVMSRSQRR